MDVQEYLRNKIQKCARYELSDADRQKITKDGLKEFLRTQMTRKKFRKWKVDDIASKKIDVVLDFCLSDKKPIVFRFWFGGYKLWRFPSSPEADWAELFMLLYYCEYLAPIIAAYEPGVELLLESDEVFVPILDNVPKSDTDAYQKSFETLFNVLRPFVPQNFAFAYVRHRDVFPSSEAFEKEYAQEIAKAEKAWKQNRSPEELERSLATSRMNIRWDGVEDLTNLSEEEKQKKIERSVILHDALGTLPTMLAFSDAPDKVPLFSAPLPGEIALGSTKVSGAKFWVGTGVLEHRGKEYYDHVVTWSQYNTIKDVMHREVPIDIVPLRNFKTISVYEQSLNFSVPR